MTFSLVDYQYKTTPLKHQKEELEFSADLPYRALFWEMGCVDSETEYLHPEGWRKISEYTGGMVAQWNPDSKKAEFVEPVRYIKAPCKTMLHIYHKYGMDQMLSPEHRVPVVERDCETIRVITAEKLYEEVHQSSRGRMLPSTFIMEGQEGIPLSDEQLRIQIAVMADGGFPKNSPHTVRTGMNLKKKRKIDRLIGLLAAAKIEYKLVTTADGYYKFAFPAPLRLKNYSNLFWQASSHQLAIICDEVMHWDGTMRKTDGRPNGGAVFFSMHEQDVDFIQYAFATQDKITRRQRDPRAEKGMCWKLGVRCKEPLFHVGREHMNWVPSTDGNKYCFEVPSGFLIFRRNGCVFPSGNCGKTKPIIDNIAYLWLKGEINGALIVAPNGVDLNWLIDELPAHLPDNVAKDSRIWRFSSKKAKTKAHKEQVKWNRDHPGLAWLLMSYDAFMTDDGKDAALLFLEQRRVFYVLDESVSIKTPGAKRTMRITRTAWRAKYRRILDGYPTPKGAFDLFSPIKFLHENFWKEHNWDSFSMFKSHFGVFEKAMNWRAGKEYEILLGYQNLEELNKIIEPISSRLKKDEVLDLPPKIYQPRYFELSSLQRALYSQLESEYKLWLDTETLVTANLAMVRMLRLQQISCGYLPVGEDEPIHMIEGKNPRLELLEDIIENENEKMIIWARYKLDIKLIEDMMRKKNSHRFVLYTGDTDDDDRIRAKKEFQEGNAQFFIGTPSAAGIGLTLHAAHTVVYYSNSFNLRHRVQSEDRAHRQGLKHPVSYIDLLGINTIDKPIMLNLCGKMNTSDVILGDDPGHDVRTQLKTWLETEDAIS